VPDQSGSETWSRIEKKAQEGLIEGMAIVYTYLTRQIIKFFGILLTAVISIYLVVDFFEKIDDFLEKSVPVSKAFLYFMFKIPFVIAQLIPVCILLAVLVVFGLMKKNNEIIALKSSGISIYSLVRPAVFIGILFTMLLFFLFEVIVPITMDKANEVWFSDVKKKSLITHEEKNIWLKGNRSITHIKYYNPADQSISGVMVSYFDNHFRLIKKLDAKKGLFKEGKWILYELMEQHLDEENQKYNAEFHKEKIEMLDFLPEDLKRMVKKSEEMSFKELLSFINKVESEGYDATAYRVDLYAKTAFPLVCIIMCIIGTGLALGGEKKEGIISSIAFGIGIAFLYWVFYSFCVSLGYGEMLPPVVAAWTANLVFLCFGFLILFHAQ
jgi:lipopolysaccharide export system permease protein